MAEKQLTKFEEFLDNLAYWLKRDHKIVSAVTSKGENQAEVTITFEDDDDPIYIGSFEEPGMSIEWLEGYKLDGCPVELVRVNGVVFGALGRHVAGWVVGCGG